MTQEFAAQLEEQYQGEIIGEVLFEYLLDHATNDYERQVWAAMLQLETETKARLRPAMVQLGVSVSEKPASREAGEGFIAALEGQGWKEMMRTLADGVQPYLERYTEIAKNAPAEYRALADSMVLHEQSLYNFAAREAAGEPNSLDEINDQLMFPVPDPASAAA